MVGTYFKDTETSEECINLVKEQPQRTAMRWNPYNKQCNGTYDILQALPTDDYNFVYMCNFDSN